jgi:N-acetylglucosamine-6-sulfatase
MIPLLALLLLSASLVACTGHGSKPNFIFIMTDDQDLFLDSLDCQPSVHKHFQQEGTWFKKHFCTVARCCPS